VFLCHHHRFPWCSSSSCGSGGPHVELLLLDQFRRRACVRHVSCDAVVVCVCVSLDIVICTRTVFLPVCVRACVSPSSAAVASVASLPFVVHWLCWVGRRPVCLFVCWRFFFFFFFFGGIIVFRFVSFLVLSLCSLSCIWFLVQSSATLVTLLRFPI
jgi:hypothetical protein